MYWVFGTSTETEMSCPYVQRAPRLQGDSNRGQREFLDVWWLRLPCSAEDVSLILVRELRPHMPWSNHMPVQLRDCTLQ